ncbi:MAG: hypothetical protein LKG15_10695 [Corynebacterium provencense]|uniref:hypothetical protein n=1 Tax=Corynebacterium provencense TaxID=1737425 RepID=UPI002989D08E|nr:hypothetical protein [Corynebacterium provencense]
MHHRKGRPVRLSAAASVGVLGVTLALLTGCDSDGAGVVGADGKDGDHTDTALSTSLTQAAPQPTTGGSSTGGPATGTGAGTGAEESDGSPHPTSGAAAPSTTQTGDAPARTTVSYGSYQVPLGDDTLLCSFEQDPAQAGYAWACEAPVHVNWQATDGGEANSVAYRPGADPEVYALLGNSGISPQDSLAAGTVTGVGDLYTVDTTVADTVTVTDTATGAVVDLTGNGYTRS